MEYGPIFKKYMNLCGQTQFSNNRLHLITKEELIMMAHNLYQHFPKEMDRYYILSEQELVHLIYETLKKVDM
jgi:hypothetical protein